MRWIWRYGLAAAAAVVCVWFVIGARQAHEESTATALLANPTLEHTLAVQRQARSAIDAAAFLNLGTNDTLLRAQLAENLRDFARARQLIDQATAAEPENLDAWLASLRLKLIDNKVVDTAFVNRLRALDPFAAAPVRH